MKLYLLAPLGLAPQEAKLWRLKDIPLASKSPFPAR